MRSVGAQPLQLTPRIDGQAILARAPCMLQLGAVVVSMRIETPQMRTVSPSIRRPHRQAPRDKEGFHVRIDQEEVCVRRLSSITRAPA
jgi:hypothetical protein